jgi:hypothetical protein
MNIGDLSNAATNGYEVAPVFYSLRIDKAAGAERRYATILLASFV